MSLRIIVKPQQIQHWISERHGTPVRRRGTDGDLAVLFDGDKPGYETLNIDELIEAMKFNRLTLLVDQEPGKTFHKFIQHG
jgi:hypothetical protein